MLGLPDFEGFPAARAIGGQNLMKLIYYIRDVGAVSSAVNVVGVNGGQFCFTWDKRRCAHVRSYDLSKEGEAKRLRAEQANIFNQRLCWPIFTDIEASGGADPKVAELEADIQLLQGEVARLQWDLREAQAPKRKAVAKVVFKKAELEEVNA